jgi:hypothetical protein
MEKVMFIVQDTPLKTVQQVIHNLERSGIITVYQFTAHGDMFCWYETTRIPQLWKLFEDNNINAREISMDGLREFQLGFQLGFKNGNGNK